MVVSGLVYGDGEEIGTVSGDIPLITTVIVPFTGLIVVIMIVFMLMYVIRWVTHER